MIFLLRTLSVSYLRRHPGKALLVVLGVAMGVGTFVAIRAAQQTLVAGLETTIDRLAGRAQVQVTGVGGVPETLRDSLRDLPAVEAEAPVIEQLVQPEPAALGTLLVVGVDLVGDNEIRDYGFEGEDADVDDPLVFLAQPDSIALSREFADRAGLHKGDVLTVRAGGALKRFTIRALLTLKGFARAYGGNVAITDVYAAEDMFGRGRRFDRIDIRFRPSISVEDGIAEIQRAIGHGYQVETPARRGTQVASAASGYVGAFNATSVVALGIGLFLIFNVFTISVQRRRREIGVVRAVGATPLQVTSLFLCEAAVLGALGGALGAALGTLIAGRCFQMMGAAVQVLQGVTDAARPTVTPTLLAEALAIGVGASLAGAWVPAQEAGRVPPADAIAVGVFTATIPPMPRWRVVAGAGLLTFAFVVARFHIVSGPLLVPLVSLCGALGTSILAGRIARAVVRPLAPLLAWIAPAAGRVAADSLAGHPRRTAATAAVLTVNMAFVLGSAGFLQSIRATFDRWVENVVTADLFVRASPGLGPSAIRLPYELRPTLLRVPGIRAVEGFRNERVPFRGEDVALVALDARGFAAHTRHEFVSGDDRAFWTGLPFNQEAVVSSSFARRFNVGVGDVLALNSPAGPARFFVAAVVVDFIAKNGTILIDRAAFSKYWNNDRVDTFHVLLEPGADPARVRDALRAALQGEVPALVSTRAEFVAEMIGALDLFSGLIRATVAIALVVAFMGVATSLLVSVADRSRDIGILKALGARARQINGAVAWEGLTLGTISLALALPLGELLAWFLRTRGSESFGGFRGAYPVATLGQILVVLPLVSIVATWLPARWASGLPIAQAITYE